MRRTGTLVIKKCNRCGILEGFNDHTPISVLPWYCYACVVLMKREEYMKEKTLALLAERAFAGRSEASDKRLVDEKLAPKAQPTKGFSRAGAARHAKRVAEQLLAEAKRQKAERNEVTVPSAALTSKLLKDNTK